MKKLLFLALGLAALSANAQILVSNEGKTLFGEKGAFSLQAKQKSTSSTLSSDATQGLDAGLIGGGITTPITGPDSVTIDTGAPLVILGNGANNSNGYISFGDGSFVSVGEGVTGDTDELTLCGYGGLSYVTSRKTGYKTIFSFSPKQTGSSTLGGYMTYNYNVPFVFNTDLKVNGVAIASDMRLKKEVEELDNSANSLLNITPVSYKLVDRQTVVDANSNAAKAAAAENVEEDTRVRYGFVAQEVREIFPDLVMEDEEGYLSVDYIGFIPLLVDAVKGLQAKVSEQEEVISALEGAKEVRQSRSAGMESLSLESVVLGQNKPNPFNVSTVIEYTLPESVVTANLYIYDLRGTQLRSIALKDRGASSVTIEASSLQPGMYIYTLVADGMELDSKRMIITE